MSIETLEKIVHQVLNSEKLDDPISLVWHAGEPLAMPIAYYENAFRKVKEINSLAERKIILSLQTNATPVNDNWIKLFKKFDVVVGVSIDGPKFIHDHFRKTRTGKGTHEKAMAGVKLLQEANVPISNIMVLTDFALDFPDEVFFFFLENQFRSIGFNIDEIEGTNEKSTFEKSNSLSRYKSFIKRFLELCKIHKGRLQVREFQDTFHSISFIDKDNPKCDVLCSTNQPMKILNFSHDGNFTTFCPELLGIKSKVYGDFYMGNIHFDKIDELDSNSNFKHISSEIERGVRACENSCEYWNFCGGGSPANKFFEHGKFDVTETMYCKIHKKALIDTILDFLEVEATATKKA